MNCQNDVLQRYIEPPLVAILRGVTPSEVIPIAEVLVDCGFKIIEVPLNSPSALESIKRLCAHFGEKILAGAGTVLDVQSVDAVADVGGRLIVTPNTDVAVIERSVALGLVSMIGCFSPSEALQASRAGATVLKVFPASSLDIDYLAAIKVVLPNDVQIYPVGGVNNTNMKSYLKAGASGFGLASNLYRPGLTPVEVKERAMACLSAFKEAQCSDGRGEKEPC